MEEPEQYAVANRQRAEPAVQQKLDVPAEFAGVSRHGRIRVRN